MADVDAIDRQLWEVFADAGRMVMRHVDRELRADLGVTSDDVAILEVVLNAQPVGVRMSDIAYRLAAEPRHATYRIERLEKKGVLSRRADVDDKRVHRVHATDQTSEFGDLCRARLGELIALYLTDLVTADRRTDLVELLSGVVDGYRHHFDPNDPNDIPPAR
ncbi:MAG: winged helix DNA-binding protein [Acidimicrobiaceae bacterium]|jgi:DNA-binding MarR family transcriptional regulator|nr:winged helix DNA-binding protein [Acidimicrobiaceae bacterium]MBT5848944.1 winged helix DNA-binding protein [Acidimicrobiaceae bacterium]